MSCDAIVKCKLTSIVWQSKHWMLSGCIDNVKSILPKSSLSYIWQHEEHMARWVHCCQDVPIVPWYSRLACLSRQVIEQYSDNRCCLQQQTVIRCRDIDWWIDWLKCWLIDRSIDQHFMLDRSIDRLIWCCQVIDFHRFEELFKLDNVTLADMDIDGTLQSNKTMTMKRPEAVTLLEPNRMRNVG